MAMWLSRLGTFLAGSFLILTFVNASWIAPEPKGKVHLIADGGLRPIPMGKPDGSCDAAKIEPPLHDYLPNTARSMEAAWRMGADMIAIDVSATSDGALALTSEADLACHSNASGRPGDLTLAELQKLDPGYRYSVDGGKSFPLRGKPGNRIASLAEGIAASGGIPLLYRLHGDAQTGELLVAALQALGRDPLNAKDGFTGDAAAVAAVRKAHPKAWAWSLDDARQYSSDYVRFAWIGFTPASCKQSSLIVPIGDQWVAWGWPNRTLARLADAGGRVMMTAPAVDGAPPRGINNPGQLSEVPITYNGMLLVEDLWVIAPGLRPSRDIRTYEQQIAADKAMEKRAAQ